MVEPANDCLLVASHNIMDGRRLAGLIRDYRALRARRGLDLLCIQENAGAFDRRGQLAALAAVLAPLAALGLQAPGFRPTHFFARQNEPKLWHRLGVQLGKLGLDLPRRYDVVCSDRRLAGWGQLTTGDSDHDLVWSRLRLE